MQSLSELESLYQETLQKLQRGERPLFNLKDEEIAFSLRHLQSLNLGVAATSDYLPLLCILDHCKRGSLKFVDPLIHIIQTRQESDLLIYTLNAALKIIIEECERNGERIPFPFIKSLPQLLSHKDPEVVEWTLRTIDSLGHQGIILKEEVLNARPGISALFNKHKKHSQDIVDMLLRRWSPRE